MNENRIKVLLVEDEATDALLLEEILRTVSASRFAVTRVTRMSEAIGRLGEERFDVVLLDLTLPDQHGLGTYSELQSFLPATPIIVLTGNDDDQLALQAVREGAQDYLVKGQVEGKVLTRVIRYAIERKRAEVSLRQSEEFFRLISENVTDLIAVIDKDGRRLYNSPSYRSLLGDPQSLRGTNAFEEIHPEDRERIHRIFQETMATGIGQRADYRMILRDGAVRHIESQGSVIKDENGRPCKVVVVSRDITERKEAVEVLRDALSDLKKSHEELKSAQLQLVQAEKLEAVSTFAAGVAHEVKNPLQTIILGVDYLTSHLSAGDANATMVLTDMGEAVQRADANIHGLLEFSATNKRNVQEEDLNAIVEQSLRAMENELINHPIRLVKDLAPGLPSVRLDSKTMKHVFINLFIYTVRIITDGGRLGVRTYSRLLAEDHGGNGKSPALFKAGETVVFAEVEATRNGTIGDKTPPGSTTSFTKAAKSSNLGLGVLKKIIELYGGVIDTATRREAGSRFTIMFKAHRR